MDEIKGRTTGIDRTRSTRNDTTRCRQTLRLPRINEFSFDAAINNGVYIVYTILVLADEKTEGGRRRGLGNRQRLPDIGSAGRSEATLNNFAVYPRHRYANLSCGRGVIDFIRPLVVTQRAFLTSFRARITNCRE